LFVLQLFTVKMFKVSAHYWPQTQRWFLVLLTAVSMMLCFRPIQTLPVTFWIYQHSWKSPLPQCCMTVRQC